MTVLHLDVLSTLSTLLQCIPSSPTRTSNNNNDNIDEDDDDDVDKTNANNASSSKVKHNVLNQLSVAALDVARRYSILKSQHRNSTVVPTSSNRGSDAADTAAVTTKLLDGFRTTLNQFHFDAMKRLLI